MWKNLWKPQIKPFLSDYLLEASYSLTARHICQNWTWERGKVVLLTPRLLLNIKTGGIKFSAPSLILDSMHLRSVSPLRIPPPRDYTCDSNTIKNVLLLFRF